jgi:Cu+-exporting ATPase
MENLPGSLDAATPEVDYPAAMLDLVCEMTVDPRDAARVPRHTHEGRIYFFCREGCRVAFARSPKTYLDPASKAKRLAEQDPEAEYTCPMCPEIRKIGPGPCPKCGMALEPARPTLALEGPSPEERSMRLRFALGALFTIPLMGLSMGAMARGAHGGSLVEALLALPVITGVGWPFHQRAWESLRNRSPNMFTLIGLGVWVSTVASLFSLFGRAHAPVYWEAAASTITLVALGQWLELRARSRTGDAVRELLARVPSQTLRLEAVPEEFGVFREQEVPTSELVSGDRIRVLPGSLIPVDGRIVAGESEIDESMMTGEPLTVFRKRGERVLAGTVNGHGALELQVLRAGEETELFRIVEGVLSAQRSRAPVQALVDRLSAVFVPAVVAFAVGVFAVWLRFGAEWVPGLSDPERFGFAITFAVAVLVIACPCALGLATPMAILVAAGRGAKAGVLFRDAASLEQLSRLDVLLLDKTGTLTEGKPEVVETFEQAAGRELPWRAWALALERSSEHPLAQAVVRCGVEAQWERIPARDVEAVPGGGVRGWVAGREILVGSARFLASEGGEVLKEGEGFLTEATLAHAVVAERADKGILLLGGFGFRDTLRPGVEDELRFFSARGVKLLVASGDRQSAVDELVQKLGLSEGRGGLSPTDKQAWVRELQNSGFKVGMLGDGLNDAAALSQADVGIAMGSGAGAAQAAAGITLLKGDLRALRRAHRLSERLRASIRQNLWLAFGYNGLAVPLAGGLLTPFFGVAPSHLAPMLGAAAMSVSSVSVIANALRLRSARLDA